MSTRMSRLGDLGARRTLSRVAPGLVALGMVASFSACREPTRKDPPPAPSVVSTVPSSSFATSAVTTPVGNPEHGRALVDSMQCARCHGGTGVTEPAANKRCVECHADIVSGSFKAPPAQLAKWKPMVADLTLAPSLTGAGKRLRRAWIESYLAKPLDLRPGLSPSMPRLAFTAEARRDIAAYLVPEESPEEAKPNGDLDAGRKVLESKGCMTCHVFGGVAGLAPSPLPVSLSPAELARGKALAPDLRHTRSRQRPSQTASWLRDPKALKADTAMPTIPLRESEIRDVVAFLHTREIDPAPAPVKVARLPLLARKVTFAEVDKRVFHRTCWHCHSEPDYAIGDGGPGNSGGFGFAPRGLNLSDYTGIAAGFLDDKGERASVFAPGSDGTPRLVAAMLARHEEESGADIGAVRGMPLGYSPIALEDIQLVDTWIAAGRPR